MTKRDLEIAQFIEDNPCRSDTIAKVFNMPIRVANRRLKALTEYGYINRYREDIHTRYFYYAGTRPKQVEHMNLVALSYVWIREQGYTIINFKREVKLDGIRPDAVALVSKNGKKSFICVEVERYNNRLPKKIDKYRMQTQITNFSILYICSRVVRDKTIDITTVHPDTIKGSSAGTTTAHDL